MSERLISAILGHIGRTVTDNRAKIREYYDSLATSYERLYGAEQARKHKEVLRLVGESKFRVLFDIGCGTGTLLGQLGQHASFIVGIDISAKMLRFAKTGSTQAEFVIAECSMLPFRDNTADCVISVSLLNSDRDHALPEMVRVLKEGGTLLATVFRSDNAARWAMWPMRSLIAESALTERETLLLATKD